MTFLFEDSTSEKQQRFDVFTAYFPPQLDANSWEIVLGELDIINSRIEAMQVPLIVTGVFNMVPWSAEIQDFKQKVDLLSQEVVISWAWIKHQAGYFKTCYTHLL